MRRRLGVAVLAAMMVVGVAGCTGGGPRDAGPTPSGSAVAPSGSPTPSPTPQPDLASIVVSATDVTLLDDSGAPQATLTFSGDDPASYVTALSASLEMEPTETTSPNGAEGAQFTTTYEWPGLLISTGFTEECLPACRHVTIVVSVPELAGVPIRTVSGISVGDSVDEARALGAQPTPEITLAAEPEDPALFGSTSEATRIVILDLDEDETTIAGLRANPWFYTFGNL